MHHFRIALALGALISLSSGCLRVGLPEHIAGTSYFEGRGGVGLPVPPINTILINPPAINPNRSIGRQFVLLVFPLSSVYLEHGFQRMAAEILTEELAAKGMVVAETDSVPKGIALYHAIPTATRLLQINYAEVSATAYDLLFTRRASVDGAVYLSLLNPNDGGTVATEPLAVQEGEFRATAFGPALTNLMERGIRKSVETSTVLKLEPPRTPPASSTTPACLVPPPQILGGVSESLANQITYSYGFKRLKPFDNDQLSRLLQRGILSGLNNLDIACAMTSNAATSSNSMADRLTFQFSELSLSPDMMQMKAKVQSNAGSGVAAIAVPIRPDVDGALAYALEDLGNNAVRSLGLGLVAQEALK